jgi:hypothetical protein
MRSDRRSIQQSPRAKERGRRRQGSTGDTAATAEPRASRRERRHTSRPRSARTPSMKGRTDRWARRAATPRLGRRAVGARRGVVEVAESRFILFATGQGFLAQQRRKRTVQVGRQSARAGRGRIRPDHHEGTRGQRSQPIASEVTQLPLHSVTHDRGANGLGDDEAHPGRFLRGVRGGGATQVDDECSAPSASSPTHSGGEFTAVTHPVSGG